MNLKSKTYFATTRCVYGKKYVICNSFAMEQGMMKGFRMVLFYGYSITVFIDILCTNFQMLLLWASLGGGVFVFGICSFSAYELLFFFNSVHKFQAETGVVFFSTSEVALLHYCEAQDFNFFSQKQGATSSGAKRSESIEWGEEIRLWHGEQLSPSVWLSVCHKRKKTINKQKKYCRAQGWCKSKHFETCDEFSEMGPESVKSRLSLPLNSAAIEPDTKTAGRLSVT